MIADKDLVKAGADPAPATPKLLVEDLAVRYESTAPGRFACHDVGFQLQPGDRLTVLGPTGCGKSTVLKAVAGYLPIAGGRIEVNGRPVSGPGQERFVMFQEFDQLFPWQTIRANIVYAFRAQARRRGPRSSTAQMREKADELLAMVGLRGRGDLYPGECSGGMKQRVALARALAVSPEVLLLDEPFGALDAQTRRRLQDQLLEVCERLSTTILFVTHDIPEAILIGNRIMMMSAGGRVSNIYSTDAHDYVDLEETLRGDLRHSQEAAASAAGAADPTPPHEWSRFLSKKKRRTS